MTILLLEHETALAETLARRLVDLIRRQPDAVLGLPTGRTPLALYAALRALSAAERLDWSRVRTFNLDEFVGLGARDEGSYRRFMAGQLFEHVNLSPEHIHFLDGRTADTHAECMRYECEIERAGGIDLQILGIGANGHIGFNEPGPALHARTHRVALLERSRADNAWWFGGDIARVPREALSMGMATILGAREVVLMATGEGKAEAVARMIEGPITTELPASFLQLHPRVTVMVDRAAAGELTDQLTAVPDADGSK